MTRRTPTKAEVAEARAALRAILVDNPTVFCTVPTVARSGMSRVMSFHVVRGGLAENGYIIGYIRRLDALIATALNYRYVDRPGVCGIHVAGRRYGYMGYNVLYHAKRILELPDDFNCQPEYI